jgi:hypothetical protein
MNYAEWQNDVYKKLKDVPLVVHEDASEHLAEVEVPLLFAIHYKLRITLIVDHIGNRNWY